MSYLGGFLRRGCMKYVLGFHGSILCLSFGAKDEQVPIAKSHPSSLLRTAVHPGHAPQRKLVSLLVVRIAYLAQRKRNVRHLPLPQPVIAMYFAARTEAEHGGRRTPNREHEQAYPMSLACVAARSNTRSTARQTCIFVAHHIAQMSSRITANESKKVFLPGSPKKSNYIFNTSCHSIGLSGCLLLAYSCFVDASSIKTHFGLQARLGDDARQQLLVRILREIRTHGCV